MAYEDQIYTHTDHPLKSPNQEVGFRTLAPSGGFTTGLFYKVGDSWGMSYQTVLEGEACEFTVAAKFITVPKATGTAIGEGEFVYLNTTTKDVTSLTAAAVGDVMVGVAAKSALSDDTSILIHMNTLSTAVNEITA